jgi:RNA-directed DNA polymerase
LSKLPNHRRGTHQIAGGAGQAVFDKTDDPRSSNISGEDRVAPGEAAQNNGLVVGAYPIVQFDFLGYSFRPREIRRKNGGGFFFGFNPGISAKSATAIRQTMRGWRFHRRSDMTLEEIARAVNPTLRGWINYYGAYYKMALASVMVHFDNILSRWAMRKYKSLMRQRNAHRWVRGVAGRQPALFAHWASRGTAAG